MTNHVGLPGGVPLPCRCFFVSVVYHISYYLFSSLASVSYLFRFEIFFEGAGFEEVPLDETNLLVRIG